ncbi:hypothetical protein OG693_38995 (plasmid) [Streptomyces sp. NBC_01259]|uniref:hypothetical protein n=1 Tax=Streptomyces sp. NBC_01259 TaxID=2903800 RepID=UPI002F907ABB
MAAVSPLAPGITFDPATFYAITATDTNPECENIGKTFEVSELYSNDGHNIVIVCGLCNHLMTITSATVLDPQPELV